MRYWRLNRSSQRLEQNTTAGAELFVPVEIHNRVGDGAYAPAPLVHDLVALDWLVELVAERIAVNLAATSAELEADKKTKTTKPKVRAAA
jgi:hypothetical protein